MEARRTRECASCARSAKSGRGRGATDMGPARLVSPRMTPRRGRLTRSGSLRSARHDDAARRSRRARRCGRGRPARLPTWRGPASPRTWCTSSTTWPSADAPSGSPFDSRPPLGFTTHRRFGEQLRLLAGRAQLELLVREQLARRVGVLAFDDVEVVGADARFVVRVARRQRRRRDDVGVVDAGERCRLAEHAAGQVRTEPSGRELNTAVARRSTTAAAPSFGEHSIHRCSGSHTTREASTSSAVTSLRNIALGLCTPLRRFFTTTSARCSLVEPASRRSRCARSAKYAGVAARPASSRHGSKNDDRMMPFGIFSTPNTSAQSYWPARIAPAASCKRGAAARAAGLDVDDRHAGERQRAEHLVARRDAAVRGAAERGLELRVARFGERGAHRVHAHLGRGVAFEPAERMQPDAGLCERPRHHPVGKRRRDERHRLAERRARAGSVSHSRVMIRNFSCASSTTPKPYGTGPLYPGGAAVTAVHAQSVAVARQHDALDVGRTRVRAGVEQREVIARRSSASNRRSTRSCRRRASSKSPSAIGARSHDALRAQRVDLGVAHAESCVSTSSVCSPSRGAPVGATGSSPTTRGNGACWRIGPITGSSTVTRSRRYSKCGSAKMSAAVYAVATGTSCATQRSSIVAASERRGPVGDDAVDHVAVRRRGRRAW